jgi:outer membrane immunogenic protein
MKIYHLATVAALTLSSASLAADRPAKKAVVPAPVETSKSYNWTGLYVGMNGGYGTNHSEISDVQFGTGVLYPYPDEGGKFKMMGSLIGGQLGYNYQWDQVVFGLEADLDYTHKKGTYAFPEPNPINLNGKIQAIGTARARLGYAFDKVLVFATGGIAYATTKATLTSVAPPVVTASSTKAYTGFAVGGGVEYALSQNWIVKADYLHINFGKQSNAYLFTGGVAEAVADTSLKTDLFRIGLNYKF